MRILMLGNSLTSANRLPELLALTLDCEVIAHTRSGARLKEHLNPNTKMGARTQAAWREPWNYVILQEMSNGPVLHTEAFLSSVQDLCVQIHRCGAMPILYATWAYQEKSPRMKKMNMSYEQMNQRMYDVIHEAASMNRALVADVGMAFYQTDENVYAPDAVHPNEGGTRLACTILSETIQKYRNEK